MSSRFLKKFLYGALYLLILSAIGAGIYFRFLRPTPTCFDNTLNQGEQEIDCGGPCASCALKALKPPKVLLSQIFQVSDAATTALVQIQNPNPTYGASRFNYSLIFYDAAGKTIFSVNDVSFIYPGETRTLVFPNLEVAFSRIAHIDFALSAINWVPGTALARPEVEAAYSGAKLEKNQVSIDGIARNKGSAAIAAAAISAVIVDKNGFYINASRTVVNGISPYGSATFKIFIPVAPAEAKRLDLAKTKLSVEAAR